MATPATLAAPPLPLPLTEWCTHAPLPMKARAKKKLVDNERLDRRLGLSRTALIIDVGSLDGHDAIRFANAAPHHRVLTFEPAPVKAEPIRSRIRKEGLEANVTLHGVALSNTSGFAQFKMLRQGSGQDMIVASGEMATSASSSSTAKHGEQLMQVPVRTLGSYVPDATATILYLKIDAQGQDYRVLRGADVLLRSHRVRGLAFEFGPQFFPGGLAEAREALHYLVRDLRYACTPCNLNPWRFKVGAARGAVSHSIDTYVASFANATSGRLHGFFDDIACEPLEECEAARRPDCHVWLGENA